MPVFDSRSFKDHEQVVFCSDPATGLRAIIAVHSTALGPAAGGTRFWDYTAAHRRMAPNDVAESRGEQDAVYDVLRLSRGMSYKNAMAGLRLGGGKSVILGNPKKIASDDLMRAFGRAVDRLGGSYCAAADVGITQHMLVTAAEETQHVSGLESGEFATGNPSPHTATGVYAGILAAAEHKFGSTDLSNKTVAVQGVGHVGYHLTRHLRAAGAKLIITDIDDSNIEAVLADGPAEVVPTDSIHASDCDIFSPCALGGGINPKSMQELKATIVAGAANNQLEQEGRDDEALRKRGVLYAPDYVINAGGIISIETEILKEPCDTEKRDAKIDRIGETLRKIFKESDARGVPTGTIANEMAEVIIKNAAEKRNSAA